MAPASRIDSDRPGSVPQTLQCMQVWGDNRAADSGVVMPGLDAWVYARPAGAADAGGDVHYVSSCAIGRIVRLLIADVSGHGAPVAEIAEKLRSLMRRYMNHADQRCLLAEINREFLGLSRLGQFATAVVISCWTPTGELTVSNAGHPSPLRFHAETGDWRPLFAPGEHANIPLGVEEPVEFSQVKVRLGRDDLLMAFSDGLIESRDDGGRMIEERGVLAMLNDLRDIEPDRIVPDLIERIGRRRDNAPPEDDTTVLLMRPNDLRPRPSIVAGLAAGARVAGGMLASLARPRSAPVPQVSDTNVLGSLGDRYNSPHKDT